MDLMQVKGNTWCLEAAELIPVYRIDDRRCILLDSGWQREREELRQALEREKLVPIGAMGSHAHLDHIGNHSWLKETYGARICMSEVEVAGVAPDRERAARSSVVPNYTQFEVPIKSQTDQFIGPEDGTFWFMGVPFSIHHTPGHSVDHICIGTPDGICYGGDLLIVGEELSRARIPYHYSQMKARLSMEKMRGVKGYDAFILAHRGIVPELDGPIEENLKLLDTLEHQVWAVLKEPVTWEELAGSMLEKNQLRLRNETYATRYGVLLQPLVEDLWEQGKVTVQADHGVRRFQRRG